MSPTLLPIFTVFQLFMVYVQSNFTLSNITLNEPIYAHFSAIYNNTLMIIAGNVQSGARLKYAVTTFPLNTNSWSEYDSSLPINTSEMHIEGQYTIQIANNIYLMNPYELPETPLSFIYSLNTNTYSILPNSPVRAAGSCIVYNPLDNKIYVINRMNINTLNISNNEWIHVSSDDIFRDYGGCSLDANHQNLYYFGGRPSIDLIQKYNIATESWSNINDTISIARWLIKCYLLSLDGYIYCIGGVNDEANVIYNNVDVFDPEIEQIVHEMFLSTARVFFSAILVNDGQCIIVCGGIDTVNYTTLDSMEYIGNCSSMIWEQADEPSNRPTLSSTTKASIDLWSTAVYIYSTLNTANVAETTKWNNVMLWVVFVVAVYIICLCSSGILYKIRQKQSSPIIKRIAMDDNVDVEIAKEPVQLNVEGLEEGLAVLSTTHTDICKVKLEGKGITTTTHKTRVVNEVNGEQKPDYDPKNDGNEMGEEGNTLALEIDNPNIGEGDIVL